MKRKRRTSDAQMRATRKWKRKHRRATERYSYKSACKNFILNWSSMSELRWAKKLIKMRVKKLHQLMK